MASSWTEEGIRSHRLLAATGRVSASQHIKCIIFLNSHTLIVTESLTFGTIEPWTASVGKSSQVKVPPFPASQS